MNLRCKACAASLGDTSGMRMTECPRCGMLQSVPDPLLISLHDRANRFRLAGDFTEAARVYAQALAAEPNDADAHWGALLSCYGVRYTYEKSALRLRLCRASFAPVRQNEHYLSAMRLASDEQKAVFAAEAEQIELARLRIAQAAQQIPPCDVFLCCRATDRRGDPTPDFLLAQQLLALLQQKGLTAFLCDPNAAGEAREASILSALSSAKLMTVLLSEPENAGTLSVKETANRFSEQNAGEILVACPKPDELPDMLKPFQTVPLVSLSSLPGLCEKITTAITHSAAKGSLRHKKSFAVRKKADKAARAPKRSSAWLCGIAVSLALLLAICAAIPAFRSRIAIRRLAEGDYAEAFQLFSSIDSRFSSNEFFQKTIYYHALELLAEKDYETAYTLLGTLNTPQALQLITDSFYELRQQLAAEGDYLTAYRLLCRLKEQIPNAEALCADTLRLLRKHPPQGLLIAESYFTIGVIPGEAPLLATQYPPHWWTRELPLGKPVSVAANDLIALGVQADGTVQFASDSNYQGEPFYSTPESWQNITSAAVGRYLAVGLKADGSVVVAGEQEDILRRQTDQWHGISFIAAGENSIVGISERGELFAAGPLSRYLDDFTGSGPFTSAFGVSDRCALLLKEDGTLSLLGILSEQFKPCLEWRDLISVSVGASHIVGFKADGTAGAAGNASEGKMNVEKWTDIVAVAAGTRHTVGLKANGTVVVAGVSTDPACQEPASWKGIGFKR